MTTSRKVAVDERCRSGCGGVESIGARFASALAVACRPMFFPSLTHAPSCERSRKRRSLRLEEDSEYAGHVPQLRNDCRRTGEFRCSSHGRRRCRGAPRYRGRLCGATRRIHRADLHREAGRDRSDPPRSRGERCLDRRRRKRHGGRRSRRCGDPGGGRARTDEGAPPHRYLPAPDSRAIAHDETALARLRDRDGALRKAAAAHRRRDQRRPRPRDENGDPPERRRLCRRHGARSAEGRVALGGGNGESDDPFDDRCRGARCKRRSRRLRTGDPRRAVGIRLHRFARSERR